MSLSNNNNDDDNGESDNEMGRAYSTSEEFSKHLNRNNVRSTTNPVEYLEFVAAQEQYAPKNLSLHQDSLPSSSQLQPTNEQFIHIKQAPSSNVHYFISPDDNPQQNLTNTQLSNNKISNNNINNYNPYFPPTEQQLQQFYDNKHVTYNPTPLSPLDDVAHSPNQYQVDDVNRQIYQQSSQYPQYPQYLQYSQYPQYQQSQQQSQQHSQKQSQRQSQQQPQQQPQQKPQKQPQQQPQQSQQFQRHNNINDNDNNDDVNQSSIDHSAVTPSPLSLPGLFLSRNRSRISTPKIENLPKIPSAYTAQVQQSDSPLRTEFRNSDLDGSNSDSSKQNNVKNMLGEILNKDRLSNFKERTPVKNTNESLVRFDFRNASGDPDDPLLNNNVQSREDKEENRPLPTGLLTGNININNNNNDNNNDNNNNIINNKNNINNFNNIDHTINIVPRQLSSIVSPISNTSITPIIQKPNENENENEKQKHDVIKIGPDVEIKVYKPKQGSILMLLAVFVLATIVFITWKLADWGIGNAQSIYDVTTNNGFLSMNPSGT
ncbi:hypothetical protein C1646_707446 [Rhizophagus diaphanus]|nr:hypothetical protein C1646_707446 [Rhizophagus diaphanus] [Rhizophagus sp. MUCL 43196]